MPKLKQPLALNTDADEARPHAIRTVIFSILGFALCWLIVSHTVVAYLATASPKIALLLRGSEPTSLLALAEIEINSKPSEKGKPSGQTQPTPKQLKLLRDQVETALVADPLSSRAYRLLGQISDEEGAARKAEAFMRAAARHSLHEGFAINWIMSKSFERKQFSTAAYYADALWRTGDAYAQNVMPILARMAEDKRGAQEIKKLLAANPRWRPQFFGNLGMYITNARTPLDLLLSLQDTHAPATTSEINAYQSFLFEHKLYGLAYYVWLQFLPPEKLEASGFLYNGDFEAKPSGSPFDWQAPAGENVIVDFVSKPGTAVDHALVVEFGSGSVEFPGVSQSIVLPPGAYAFRGSLNGEVIGPRGVQWSISCVGGAKIGESEMILGSFQDWRAFEFSVVVPENGCSVQLLQLKLAARSPSELLVSGAIWFDALSITREGKKP
ncbi:hypothetical protein IYY11_04110 [Methylocystis sp. H62]|uniref:hypothetical protein n=1 Tax=Methylocystis sp. H62 TaxID=2785789 RepID=UPI0018C22B40|nr:hypothetical protein [Methylocystis sp. H62]MBG0792618.1 hypothetical protein [Methylocystis sp. H62]